MLALWNAAFSTSKSARPVGHYVGSPVSLFARLRPPLSVLVCIRAGPSAYNCVVRLRLCAKCPICLQWRMAGRTCNQRKTPIFWPLPITPHFWPESSLGHPGAISENLEIIDRSSCFRDISEQTYIPVHRPT